MSVHVAAIPFFTNKELACPCCGVIKMDVHFAATLSYLRSKHGSSLTLNSACRCPAHNARIPGHKDSLHLIQNEKWKTAGSMAADVAWRDWPTQDKIKFARLAHSLGLRVGLHDGFCHVDLGRTLGLPAKPFLYGTWSNEFNPEDVL
jgi:hypothetical protein